MSKSVSKDISMTAESRNSGKLVIRNQLRDTYEDVYTPEVLDALESLSRFNHEQKTLMENRMLRRSERIENDQGLTFLDPDSIIPRTNIRVQDARDGRFTGSGIPQDLQRQWIQGTGPAAKPKAPFKSSIRNVAYALLSGADGWMFDGEDALGQVQSMSLDNQRNLKLAIHKNPEFLEVAEQVAAQMNHWSAKYFGREVVPDWRKQLDFTTKIFRARGLHLDDRHIRDQQGTAMSASIVDMALYVVNNYRQLQKAGHSIVLYLPKIQTAEEAAFWNELISALEDHLGISHGTIKTYVLVEQLEAAFQLMEIRAALGTHFVGYNTGRWDYINSVADAMAGISEFINPNIEAITMTYGYMRNYEDRVRRAVNTPDQEGRFALWQGGMEPNIPVGSESGVERSMEKAVAGAVREQSEGASGKWVAHWKMVHIVRPVWEKNGEDNQLGRSFPRLTYTPEDVQGLSLLEPAPRTIRGARNLLSVALQYGNAFGQGYQAAALKPADDFGNDDILYLMEDMATGEIRVSILWEWIHKQARLSEDDPDTGLKSGTLFTPDLFDQLLVEEFQKLLTAEDRDVHDDSKKTTLPIALEIVKTCVMDPVKVPWYIDLLNFNLNNMNPGIAGERIFRYMETLKKEGSRITENPDFPAGTTSGANEIAGQDTIERQLAEIDEFFQTPRFRNITRAHTPRQVVEQKGSILQKYPVAQQAAEEFYRRLEELFAGRKSITTFGPYSPGQAVMMKRMGIEGIYLGGWATSAKGSINENPGPDLASYPLSQVPDEAAPIVRGLLAADKNQEYTLMKMSPEDRATTRKYDFRPFIIADADTGHGGEAHVRNLIRRFVEVGVPGYHIEDQKPGVKKCGHQGGKVLVPQDEQNKRLNAARFQLDVMGVPGIIVARTDAEAATLLDGRSDERDQPFILGATRVDIPTYRTAYLAVLKKFFDSGIREINGHLLYGVSDNAYDTTYRWLEQEGILSPIEEEIDAYRQNGHGPVDTVLERVMNKFLDAWQARAGMKTFGQAVADVMEFQIEEGIDFELDIEEWQAFSQGVSYEEARGKARSMGINAIWNCELAKSPEGYYQVQGGIDYAIVKSLAAAPFADLIWMETKTANLEDAKRFAEAIHAVYPEQMLAYNLSPSFNWDTTGMTEDEMKAFPKELGKLGFVFNFITYGGHQIDGLAAEEFATALRDEGMLALARLQRTLRLLNSPYKTPQSHVGGSRIDAALTATTGRTATTKAMGKGSTQVQHLVQTEVPASLLEEWLELWSEQNDYPGKLHVELRPHRAGSDLLELSVLDDSSEKISNIIFSAILDRRNRRFLSIRDQNMFNREFRKKRLVTLIHLFLIHRYKSVSIHYVSPTEDNERQTEKMKTLGIFTEVNTEIGHIIVALVNGQHIQSLLNPDRVELNKLISRSRNG
jgi:isocitrate lyase